MRSLQIPYLIMPTHRSCYIHIKYYCRFFFSNALCPVLFCLGSTWAPCQWLLLLGRVGLRSLNAAFPCWSYALSIIKMRGQILNLKTCFHWCLPGKESNSIKYKQGLTLFPDFYTSQQQVLSAVWQQANVARSSLQCCYIFLVLRDHLCQHY
jgi:hypothetical protein